MTTPGGPRPEARAVVSHRLLAGGGREQGREALGRCVGDVDAFLGEVYTRRPAYWPGADARGTFRDLFDREGLEEILRRRTLHLLANDLRVVRTDADGFHLVDPARWTVPLARGAAGRSDEVDPAAVWREVGAGASLALQLIDRYWAPLTTFCRNLELFLGFPTQATAYLTPPSAQGLDVHHDTHDVLVLMLEGTKEFTLYAPVLADPLPGQHLSDLPSPELRELSRLTLNPGDVLYLPRGYPHVAATTATTSLHLTVGLMPLTWAGALAEIADLVRELSAEDLELRRAVPLGAAFGDAGFVQRVEELADDVAGRVRGLISSRMVLAPALALMRSRDTDAEPDAESDADAGGPVDPLGVEAWSGASRVRLRQGALLHLTQLSDQCVVEARGRRVAIVPMPVGRALAQLLDAAEPLATVPADRRSEVLDLIVRLVRLEVVEEIPDARPGPVARPRPLESAATC